MRFYMRTITAFDFKLVITYRALVRIRELFNLVYMNRPQYKRHRRAHRLIKYNKSDDMGFFF